MCKGTSLQKLYCEGWIALVKSGKSSAMVFLTWNSGDTNGIPPWLDSSRLPHPSSWPTMPDGGCIEKLVPKGFQNDRISPAT